MKIHLEVYGCTANKNDASIAKGLLEQHHHTLVDDLHEADILVLLTCTVIATTEQRMVTRLRVFHKTGKPVVVSGCMASVQQPLIHSIIPEARLLPPQSIHHIVDLVENNNVVLQTQPKTGFAKHYDQVIAPVGIAEGCASSCTYCITCRARGTLHSYPSDGICNDVKVAVAQGCKEIQLTAQDTASYGQDNGTSLSYLLQDLSHVQGPFRVRVGMMNPARVMPQLNELLEAFNDERIYKFLHLPVQSGDDEILRKMNRRYQVEEFETIVQAFRKTYPNLTLATDIIVGFPSETEEQFQQTLDLLQRIQPDVTNITRFSARPLTTAKTMKGRLPTKIVKQRSIRASELCPLLSLKQNQQHIGKHYTLLITEKGKHGSVVGRAENYKPVVIKGHLTLGSFVPVEIVDATPTHLVGRLI
jgi:threonylcarbamoyladenosine tRNA methylthiotransferase CDKAL1